MALAVLPRQMIVDTNGVPRVAAKLYFYLAGTTTPITVYTTGAYGPTHTNPVVSVSNGFFPAIYVNPAVNATYKMVAKDSADVTIWTEDNIPSDINTPNDILAMILSRADDTAVTPDLSITAAETAALVTPTNYAYPPGDVRRYGAVMDGATNDSAAFASAALVFTQGQDVYIPPLQSMLTSQVTFVPPNYRRGLISGYGSELFTTGAISAIRVQGNTDPHGVTVEGITVNQRNNTLSIAGFEAVGTSNIRFVDCIVEANNCPAGYGGFYLRNSTPSNNNTGSFWSLIEKCAVRKRAGADPGTIPNGVILAGSCNASSVINSEINNCTTAILVTNESGQTFTSNGVTIMGNDLANGTTGISCVAQTANPQSGLRIISNRFEVLTTGISLTGATAQPAVPTFLCGNYVISSVTTYISNANTLYLNVFDWSITPSLNVGPTMASNQGLTVIPITSGNHAFDGWSSGGGFGYALRDNNGNLRSRWCYDTAPAGARLTAIQGISKSETPLRKNLCGNDAFVAAALTRTITFPNNEPDGLYRVVITPTSDWGAQTKPPWVSARGTTGFTVNAQATTTGGTFDWMIIGD